MSRYFLQAAPIALVAAFALAAPAQAAGAHSGGFLSELFGGGDQSNAPSNSAGSQQVAQISQSDVVVRLERLETEVRQLTGQVQELQYRNQQLEQALQRLQPNGVAQAQQTGVSPSSAPPAPAAQQASRAPLPASQIPPESESASRRHDAFNPALHPNAPGVPRPLGGGGTIISPEPMNAAAPSAGVPASNGPGAPLDLSTVDQPGAQGAPGATPEGLAPGGQAPAAQAPGGQGQASLPPPPPANPSATGALASVQPPTHSARDEYDLAYGYMLQKDYGAAEDAFKTFLQQHPDDHLVADATYYLGESLYQQRQYRDAAKKFLTVTTQHEKSGRAPDALFRLGQSLAQMGQKEAACATLGEVARKYPHAASSVKVGVSREEKRVHC